MDTVDLSNEPSVRTGGRRIVLTTFGSLGDLYPYIAIALGLKARGHDVIIATSPGHQGRVEARGVGFHPVPPEGPSLIDDPEGMRHFMDRRKGSESVIRELMMPVLAESYQATMEAARGADLLICHPLTFVTPLVAETTGIRWASVNLQPLGFFSAHDPPVLAPMPSLAKLRFLGPAFHGPFFRWAKWSIRSWADPWHRLRAEVQLPPTSDNPLFEGLQSPALILAMFSRHFACKQPDWPPQAVTCGFPFLDQQTGAAMPAEVVDFLDSGPPPIVFTLGSSAMHSDANFFEYSAAAARLLGRRAVLVLGNDRDNRPASLDADVIACDYVPFFQLFPRAAAIVHPGGIGTTGLVMHSGRPMLVMPCAHDQFDNAARVTRLGIGRTISQQDYRPELIAVELRKLLDNPRYSERASVLGAAVRREDGISTACDHLEKLLENKQQVEPVEIVAR
jgi:UDP:flavonoid glycosyltransferase YjiC (YdhE family)